jgi:hypothetical protein
LLETWSAEVDLGLSKDRSLSLIRYTQDGGTVTFRFTGIADCGYPGGSIDVPTQTVPVSPVQDAGESDFLIVFDPVNPKYGGRTGLRYGTLPPAHGTQHCPPPPAFCEEALPAQAEAPIEISHYGSALPKTPGKLGKSLSGGWSYEDSETEFHALQWKLTPTK